MRWQHVLRGTLAELATKRSSFVLRRQMPDLEQAFRGIEQFGLYLHIPFCRQICPYCPYNKEIFTPEAASRYVQAVKREVDIYSRLIAGRPVTSFYIGGGTPTTMLGSGIEEILEHVHGTLNMRAEIHMESHPSDLSPDNLRTIAEMGVEHLSMGVEALQDHHLSALQRPYTSAQARTAIARAVAMGFKCVSVDVMFALPGQTEGELEEEARALVELGVGQVAAYPIFAFSYTRWGEICRRMGHRPAGLFQKRHMLAVFERVFYGADFERTSVWAFTRRGVPKYCSGPGPLDVGLGASGGSYLRDVFYLDTFNVREYCTALEQGRMPIALSLALSEEMQIAGWLYWRVYETRFRKSDFTSRFGIGFDSVYGPYFELLSLLGLLKMQGDEIVLTDAGSYWLHALQDVFSLEYVGKLWGISQVNPWPERVVL